MDIKHEEQYAQRSEMQCEDFLSLARKRAPKVAASRALSCARSAIMKQRALLCPRLVSADESD